jgi:hypothetical protein
MSQNLSLLWAGSRALSTIASSDSSRGWKPLRTVTGSVTVFFSVESQCLAHGKCSLCIWDMNDSEQGGVLGLSTGLGVHLEFLSRTYLWEALRQESPSTLVLVSKNKAESHLSFLHLERN